MSTKMPISGTEIEIQDNSGIPTPAVAEISIPNVLIAFASPKGTEDLCEYNLDDGGAAFVKMYGDNPEFAKYGQPLLTATDLSKNGAQVLAKRVVADDATLANIVILGKVSKTTVQKTDSEGNLIYTDAVSGEETTIADGNTPVNVSKCVIKLTAESVPSVKTIDEIETVYDNTGKTVENETDFTTPLFIISDNGRGESNKKFRITPDYMSSKRSPYMQYQIEIYDGGIKEDTINFLSNPNVILHNNNNALSTVINSYSTQVKCVTYDANIVKFANKIGEFLGDDTIAADMINMDFLFARNRRGNIIPNLSLDLTSEDACNLTYSFGIQLKNGTNGAFGDCPIKTEAYKTKLVEFFNGTTTDEIYDLDNYKIDAVIDCAYPNEVKREIESLAEYREDFFYFRDLGLDIETIDDAVGESLDCAQDKFSGTYYLVGDILDPYTKKPIRVTCTYELGLKLIDHFRKGRNRPFAGAFYNVIFTKFIKGTENFIPKVTPKVNQREILVDNRINYAVYYDKVLTQDSQMTNQVEYTQLSYINNVLLIQQIVKAIRSRCPKTRYHFIDGDDLEKYKDDVNTELDKYSTNFYKLQMVYQKDTTMEQNKIFYAVIYVIFKNFIQREKFTLCAVNTANDITLI